MLQSPRFLVPGADHARVGKEKQAMPLLTPFPVRRLDLADPTLVGMFRC